MALQVVDHDSFGITSRVVGNLDVELNGTSAECTGRSTGAPEVTGRSRLDVGWAVIRKYSLSYKTRIRVRWEE